VNQMSVPSVPPPMPVAFSGSRSEFFDLVKRGAGLEFVTLGFYRFWLITDIRRHLWTNTQIEGDGAEYTGRAKELLIGFLIALAILVPVYLAYFLVGLEAERLQALASLPLVASMSGDAFWEFFQTQEFARSIPLLVLAGAGYLMFALCVNVVIRVYLVRDLWVRVLESINIHGIEAAANVTAQGELANALGEGFADGLDVAGF